MISPCRQATLAILHARPASPKSRLLLRVGFHSYLCALAILLPSPASHEGTLAILRFQEDLGDLGTKYDGGLHARPPRFRGTQGTLAILGPRGHSSGPIRKQRKFPDFKVARSSGAIFCTCRACTHGANGPPIGQAGSLGNIWGPESGNF